MQNNLFTISEKETIKRFLEQQEFMSLKHSDEFMFMSKIDFDVFVFRAHWVIELLLHRNECSQSLEQYEVQSKNDNQSINK
jgi:hypothetical protein